VGAELTVLTGADERDLTRLDEYRAIGGYGALERARGMTPAELIDQRRIPARTGRRRLPDGPEAEPGPRP
jgi:hypothetical protein